jgi:peptidoglycan biosynthesis protein MviN/MurJ (putative lipid II flippase)
MRESGLALATSITAIVNVAILLALARRRFPHFDLGPVVRSAGLSTIAGATCGGGAWLALRLDVPLALRVLGAVAAGGLAFALTAAALRQPEWGLFRKLLRRREDN